MMQKDSCYYPDCVLFFSLVSGSIVT